MALAPTVRTAQVRTKGTQAVLADRHVVDMQKKVYMLDSGQNPALRALTMRSSVVPVKSFEPSWLEDSPVPEWDVTTATSADNDTTFDVANGTYFKAGDLVRIPRTGEYVLVGSVSSNVVTVTRGVAGTAAALNSGERLHNMGLVDTEGNTSPEARTTIMAKKSNFTRTLKTPVELSRTTSQVELYGGNERPRLRKNAGVKHARLLELDLFHGTKLETVSGATVRRYAGGLDHFVQTNILTVNGMLSESELYEWLGTVYRHGVDGAVSNGRVLFAGQALMNTISMWGQNKLTTDSGRNKAYGFHISSLLTPYGTLDIVYHPLLEEEYEGYGYVCDMSGIKIGQLQPTVLQTDIQAPDLDGYKDQYLSEQTYMVMNEQAFGIIKGVEF